MGLFAGYHIGFAMLIFGMVFAIISVSSVGWARDEISIGVARIEYFYGLFEVCVEVNGDETCREHSDPHDKLQASRALATSGMICIIIAVCLVSVHMFLYYRDRSKMPSTATLIAAICVTAFAAVINTIANIIYGEFYDSEYPGAHIYYAYTFLIIASILASLGSSFAYAGRPRRIEVGAVVTTSNGHTTTVAFITASSSQQSSAITNPAYPPQPPPYGYPSYPKQTDPSPPYYPAPANPDPAYRSPGYSDPAYPPPQPASYEPPKY